MKERKEHYQYLVYYSQYLNGKESIEDFCVNHEINYLEFVHWINDWEERHGGKIVEEAMQGQEYHAYRDMRVTRREPSRAERMFKSLLPSVDEKQLRSRRFFPENPNFEVELELPIPNTIIKGASITFPGGATLRYDRAAIKTLILTIVLYEEFGSWSLE